MSIVLRNNTIQVIATVNNNMIIISSETSLEIQTWHHILISFSNIQLVTHTHTHTQTMMYL